MAYYEKIDIHGFTVAEAKTQLDLKLRSCAKETRELVVIHGYQHGQTLQQFVRKQYHHKRIEMKMISLNPGETIFRLK